MFCKHCGARTSGVAFCTGCGKSLPVVEQTANSATSPPPQAAPPTSMSQQAPPVAATPAAVASPPPAQTVSPPPQQTPRHAQQAPRQAPAPQNTPSVAPAQQRPQPQTAAAARQPSPAARQRVRRGSGGKIFGLVTAVILLLGGAGGAVWWLLGPDDRSSTATATSGGSYGSDQDLDVLWDRCEAGSLSACDDLYFLSASGTEYEDFGATCGNRDGSPGLCAPQGADAIVDDEGFGTDPELDLLWLGCEDGDMLACDDLYFGATPTSAYEEFGRTCGFRGEGFGDCVSLF